MSVWFHQSKIPACMGMNLGGGKSCKESLTEPGTFSKEKGFFSDILS